VTVKAEYSGAALASEEAAAPVATALAPLCVDAAGLGVLLGISGRQVRRLDSAGKIPAPISLGGSRRWSVEEVQSWLRAGGPPRARWASMRREAT
jgi:predicted DNA-binding transcriptional regulator AlpA